MSKTYMETVLLANERLEYVGYLHWIIFVPGLCSAVGGAVLCLLPFYLLKPWLVPAILAELHRTVLWAGLSGVGAGVLLLVSAYLRMLSTELAITNRRIIAKTGFISRNTFEMMLTRIEGANIEQSVLGRVLNFGSVYVHGTGGGITPIDHVVDPLGFKRHVLMGVEKNQYPAAAGGQGG